MHTLIDYSYESNSPDRKIFSLCTCKGRKGIIEITAVIPKYSLIGDESNYGRSLFWIPE